MHLVWTHFFEITISWLCARTRMRKLFTLGRRAEIYDAIEMEIGSFYFWQIAMEYKLLHILVSMVRPLWIEMIPMQSWCGSAKRKSQKDDWRLSLIWHQLILHSMRWALWMWATQELPFYCISINCRISPHACKAPMFVVHARTRRCIYCHSPNQRFKCPFIFALPTVSQVERCLFITFVRNCRKPFTEMWDIAELEYWSTPRELEMLSRWIRRSIVLQWCTVCVVYELRDEQNCHTQKKKRKQNPRQDDTYLWVHSTHCTAVMAAKQCIQTMRITTDTQHDVWCRYNIYIRVSNVDL